MRLAHQDRQDLADLAHKLAATEIKLMDQTISTTTSQSCATLP